MYTYNIIKIFTYRTRFGSAAPGKSVETVLLLLFNRDSPGIVVHVPAGLRTEHSARFCIYHTIGSTNRHRNSHHLYIIFYYIGGCLPAAGKYLVTTVVL